MPGWLAPDGTFVTAGGRGHGRAAHAVVAPETPYQPDQTNYELELERRRYLKLMISTYWSGWCRPSFRITRPQQDIVVDWYTERGLRCPEWVTQ